jgi:hypothetical protein
MAQRRGAKRRQTEAQPASPRLPGMSFLEAEGELLRRCKGRFEKELQTLQVRPMRRSPLHMTLFSLVH